MDMKTCKKCGESKPATTEYYYKTKGNKDDLAGKCKVCTRMERRNYYSDNKNIVLNKTKEYRERNVSQIKEKKRQYYLENREYIIDKQKKYYIENLNERLEYISNYNSKHKEKRRVYRQNRRAALNGNNYSLTKEQWLNCLNFFDWKDAYTGLPLKEINIDHIIPVSKGGASHISNVVPCEASINFQKHNKDMLDWYKSQSFFDEQRLQKIYQWIELNSDNNKSTAI